MRIHTFLVVAVLLAVAAVATAQEDIRAWQQRIDVDIPLPVPVLELQPVNPFYQQLDAYPKPISATPPRKLVVNGRAEVAVYVNEDGVCPGAIPLHTPFPGLTSPIQEECKNNRFEPAKAGKIAKPSWAVLEIAFSTKIKESSVIEEALTLSDPAAPPQPAPSAIHTPGRMASLRAADPSTLTSPLDPKRLRVRVSGRDQRVPVRALVHITADGRCDGFVPLEIDTGFYRWLSAFLASWRLEPARAGGQATDCWMVYTAQVQLKLGTLDSATVRVLRDRHYDPTAQ
jgi:hypothetical protein